MRGGVDTDGEGDTMRAWMGMRQGAVGMGRGCLEGIKIDSPVREESLLLDVRGPRQAESWPTSEGLHHHSQSRSSKLREEALAIASISCTKSILLW